MASLDVEMSYPVAKVMAPSSSKAADAAYFARNEAMFSSSLRNLEEGMVLHEEHGKILQCSSIKGSWRNHAASRQRHHGGKLKF